MRSRGRICSSSSAPRHVARDAALRRRGVRRLPLRAARARSRSRRARPALGGDHLHRAPRRSAVPSSPRENSGCSTRSCSRRATAARSGLRRRSPRSRSSLRPSSSRCRSSRSSSTGWTPRPCGAFAPRRPRDLRCRDVRRRDGRRDPRARPPAAAALPAARHPDRDRRRRRLGRRSPGRYLAFLALYDALFALVCWASFEYVVTE